MLQHNYHVITGLPRSGSTLLSALLSQNPAFHASMSTPVLGCLLAIRNYLNQGDRMSESLVSEQDHVRMLRSVVAAYYEERVSKTRSVIFDTNRSWSGQLDLLHMLSASSKAIVCVRNMADVLNSFEWQFRRNPLVLPKFFSSPEQWNNVYSRVETMVLRGGVVGEPWVALKEGLYGTQSDRLLLLDYDLLVRSPLKVLERIYEFLGIELWQGHTINNVALLDEERLRTQKFDELIGAPELHKLRGQVEREVKQMLLPPDLRNQMNELNFWLDREGSSASALIAS